MHLEVVSVERLRFDDGTPVRAASAVVPFANGFLVVSDDATHAAWVREGSVSAVRLLPPVEGHDLFSEAAGTKQLKPDLEAACPLTVDDEPAALVMGSGSSSARMRWVLLRTDRGEPRALVADMAPLYARVAVALSLAPEDLNLEGACIAGPALRWFHRGLASAGQPSMSIDLDLAATVAASTGRADPAMIPMDHPRTYEVVDAAGTSLALTDVVNLPDGGLVASAVAEDSPNPRDDGSVLASALVLLDDVGARDVVSLPLVDGDVVKIEGLMVVQADEAGALLLAVADVDDPGTASQAIRLRLRL